MGCAGNQLLSSVSFGRADVWVPCHSGDNFYLATENLWTVV